MALKLHCQRTEAKSSFDETPQLNGSSHLFEAEEEGNEEDEEEGEDSDENTPVKRAG